MFRGNYKTYDYNGVVAKYFVNDTVVFQGRIYKCSAPTSNSPIQSPIKWEYIGNHVLYSGANPPISPKIGQSWETNGKIYTYYYDGTNYSWVQF